MVNEILTGKYDSYIALKKHYLLTFNNGCIMVSMNTPF